jgi:hypothetical protein
LEWYSLDRSCRFKYGRGNGAGSGTIQVLLAAGDDSDPRSITEFGMEHVGLK